MTRSTMLKSITVYTLLMLLLAVIVVGCMPDRGSTPGQPYEDPNYTNVYVYENIEHHDTCYVFIGYAQRYGGISCISND